MGDEFLHFMMHFIAAALAVTLALWGNYHLQHRIRRRLDAVNEIQKLLNELLKLSTTYWIYEDMSNPKRKKLGIEILVLQKVISLEFVVLSDLSRSFKSWYADTVNNRLKLIETVTGGNFLEIEYWRKNDKRVAKAESLIRGLVQSLNQIC